MGKLLIQSRRIPLYLGMLAMLLAITAVACGGGDDDDAATATTAAVGVAPTAAVQQPTATTAPPVSKFNGNLRLGEILIDPPISFPANRAQVTPNYWGSGGSSSRLCMPNIPLRLISIWMSPPITWA